MINIKNSPYRNEVRREYVQKSSVSTVNDKVISVDLNPKFLIVVLAVIGTLLATLYLVNFNKFATKGFQLTKLENLRNELENTKQVNNLILAKAKAMNSVMERDRVSVMRKAQDIEFVYGGGEEAIAKK